MKKVQVYGFDPGNSSLKVFNGSTITCIENCVAPGHERRLYKSEEGHLKDYLDVSIESNGKALGRYFVGSLAYKEGGSSLKEESQNGNSKSNNEDTYVMSLVGLALDQYSKRCVLTQESNLVTGSGLPTEEFYSKGAVDHFEKKLIGKHKITFNHDLFKVDGKAPTVILNINETITLPESAAAMMNHIFNNDGDAIEGRDKCLVRLIITIDIGALTTDVSAIEQNSSISNLTFGIPKGLFHGIDKIIDDIEEEHSGCRFTRKQIIDAITDGTYLLAYKRDDINFKEVADKRINELAKEIMESVRRKLKRQRPNIENEAYTTFAVGGSVIPMQKILEEELKELQLEIPKDPVGANARGYYKSAYQIYQSMQNNEVAASR